SPSPFPAHYFYRPGCHLYLHSFPTRRSSDLNYYVTIRLGKKWVSYGIGLQQINREKNKTWAGPENPFMSCLPIIRDYNARFPLLDRKSTRLNSSHVSISYAVFCLKKKTCEYR